MLYVRDNEHTNRLKVVTVVANEKDVPPQLKEDLEFSSTRLIPSIYIEFVVQTGESRPQAHQEAFQTVEYPRRFHVQCFAQSDLFLYGFAELGGVRLGI